MIMSIKEIENYIDIDDYEDEVIEQKLEAIEQMIRSYTNNNFQSRTFRAIGNIQNGIISISTRYFKAGDTVEISRSCFNTGLYTVEEIGDGFMKLNGSLYDENKVQVTKILYPADIKNGAINLLKWELENRDKVGIKSETISRHSVTYYDMDSNNLNGYPSSLLGFMTPYRKARF